MMPKPACTGSNWERRSQGLGEKIKTRKSFATHSPVARTPIIKKMVDHLRLGRSYQYHHDQINSATACGARAHEPDALV